ATAASLAYEQGRHEIDLVAELAGERLIGIEIKADAAPTARDGGKHLLWLRDELGDRPSWSGPSPGAPGHGINHLAQLGSPDVAVDVLQALDPLDVGPRLRERDPLPVCPPAINVFLARVVRGERGSLVAVLVQQMPQVPRAVADVDLRVIEIPCAKLRA